MGRKNNLVHGGRIVKYKGNAASYAPSFGLAHTPAFSLAPAFKRAALALLSSATIAILASSLVPSAALAQTTLYWDSDAAENDTVSGGAGTWGVATGNWTNSAGSANQVWTPGANAYFSGVVADIELDGDQTVGDMTFVVGGWNYIRDNVGGDDDLVLESGGTSTFTTTGGAYITIQADITGNAALTKAGNGWVMLSGANDYTGLTTISAGTLSLNSTTAISDTGAVQMSDGTRLNIQANTTLGSVNGSGTLTLEHDTLTIGGNNTDSNFSGNIDRGLDGGSGSVFTKQGTGTLTLSGNSTTAGSFNLQGGTTDVTGSVNFQTINVSNAAIFNAATSALDTGADVDLNDTSVFNNNGDNIIDSLVSDASTTINLNAGTLTTGNAGNQEIAGNITGVGSLTKQGTGTLNLSNTNTYTGATTVSAGTLNVTGSIAYSTVPITINGTGTLQAAAGALNSSAGIDLSGTGTFVNNGTNTIDTIVSTTSTTINLAGGTLITGNGGTQTIAGNITGTGNLTKSGSGTLVLANVNSGYLGVTQVNDGTLAVGVTGALGGGNVRLSGGGITLSLSNGVSVGNALAFYGNANVNVSGVHIATYSGQAFAAGDLIKVGTGTLNLTGDSALHTGNYTVQSGTLAISGGNGFQDNGSVTLNAGTTLQVSGTEAAGGLTGASGSSLVLNAGSEFQVNGDNSTSSFAGVISGDGGLTKQGTETLTLSAANTYAGATTVSAGILDVTGSIASTDINIGGTGTLQVDGTSILDTAAITLNGTGILNNTGNETIGSISSAAGSTISLAAGILTTGNAGTQTVAGNITGAGDLYKQGTGTLTLSGVNNYTGQTRVYAGELTLQGGSAISDASTISLMTGPGILNVQDSEAVGILSASIGTTINIAAGETLSVGNGVANNHGFSIDSVINGDIIVAGGRVGFGLDDGVLNSLVVNSGKAQIQANNFTVTNSITVANGARLEADLGGWEPGDDPREALSSGTEINLLSGSSFMVGQNQTIDDLYGAGNIEIGNSGALVGSTTLTTGSATDRAIQGVISSDGQLIKQGDGILTLSGGNTYTGGTTVSGGTLSLQNNSAAGTGTITTTGSTIDYANGVNIDNLINIDSGTTKLQVLTGSAEQSGIISETGGVRPLEKIGDGTLVLSVANTYTGATTVTAGTLDITGSIASTSVAVQTGATLQVDGASILDTAALTLNGTGILNNTGIETIGSLAGSGTVIMTSDDYKLTAGGDNSSTLFSGRFDGDEAVFTKTGTGEMIVSGGTNILDSVWVDNGTMTLIGDNFAADFLVNNGGTLVVNNVNGNAIADSSVIGLNSNGIFKIQTNETIAGFDETSNAASVFLNGGTLTIENTGNTSLAAIVSGAGGIIKQGAGTLRFSGNNTYTGATIINEGILRATANNAALGINSAVTVNASGTLELDEGKGGSAFTLDIGSLAGAGIVELDANSLSVGGDDTDTDFSGGISGTGSVIKTGTGNLTLSGINTYTGLTTISAGTLSLTGGAAIADAGAVTVSSGGTLNILTSETIGAMNNAGIINLQNSAIGNNLTIIGNYENTGTLKIDVNKLGASDTLDVTGTVTLGGILDVFSMGAEADYPLGDSFEYTIIANDAADAVIGTFASIENNFAFLDPTINTSGGDGNDVVLTMSSTNPIPDFKPFAANANQSSVAKALDNFNYDSTGGQIVRNAIIGLNNSQVEAALVQFSGADHEASSGLGNIVSGAFRSIMMGRSGTMGASLGGRSSAQSSLALGYAQAPQTNNETLDAINEVEVDDQTFSQPSSTIWTKAFASYSSVDGGANSANIYAFNAGVVFGGEITDPNLGLFGVSAGYSGSQFSTLTAGATSKADNFHVGIYGMWGSAATAEAGWGFSGALDYTYNMYETRRPINVGGLDLTAAADYGGYSIGGEFKARYGFESELFGSNSIISPFAGVNFLNSKNNAFSETGAGALNISATEIDTNRIASLLGFEISSQAIMGETPVNSRISVGWQHEFGDANQINSFRLQGSPTQFLVASPKEARDKLVLNAGLDFATSNNAMLTLSANGEASSTSLAYGGSISYKLQF